MFRNISFLELLTVVFVVLKLTGTIAWSWWLVLLPALIHVGAIAIFLVITVVLAALAASLK